MNCEMTTDLLPDLASGALDHATAAALHAHIAACAGCAAEWRVVHSVRASAMAVPADLEAGIAAAVARASAQGGSRGGAAGLRVGRGRASGSRVPRYAMAAAVACALFGGILAVQQLGDPASTGPADDPVAAPAIGSAPAFPVTTDPLVGNQSAVSELSAEQLEALLTEMDS